MERKKKQFTTFIKHGQQPRKKHSPEFKAKVALEALKEQKTLAELEKEFGVSQFMISRWKKELLTNASQSFGAKPTVNDDARQKEIDKIHTANPGRGVEGMVCRYHICSDGQRIHVSYGYN